MLGTLRLQPAERSDTPRFVAALVIVAVVGLLLGTGGSVTWSHHGVPEVRAASSDVDYGAAIRRAEMRPTATAAGVLEAKGEDYGASFDRTGMRYRPFGQDAALALSVREVNGSAVAPSAWQATGTVAGRSLGPGLREQATVRAHSVEWDVVLDHRPASGGLVIDADLAGVEGEPERIVVDGRPAWRLTLAGDLHPVTIDESVVLDADGDELYRALPAVTASSLHIAIPASILRGAKYPVIVDPTVSGPKTVPSQGEHGFEQKPVVAFNGTNVLVVWEGEESACNGNDIYALLLDGDGDAVGSIIDVATDECSESQLSPAVASNGSNFLLAWQDFRAPDSSQGDIWFAVVSAAGARQATFGLTATPTLAEGDPAVGSNGTNYLVTWTRAEGGTTNRTYLEAARVTSAGQVSAPNPIRLTNSTSGSQFQSSVAFGGGNYLVVYNDTREGSRIYGTRISPGGTIRDPAGFRISQPPASGRAEFTPDVASDGTTFLVVWQQTGTVIRAARVQAKTVLDTTPLEINSLAIAAGAADPAVAFNATFLVVWTDVRGTGADRHRDVQGNRVKPDGTVLDGSGFAITSSAAGTEEQIPDVAAGEGKKWITAYCVNPAFEQGRDFLRAVSPSPK
jgi:hypothetical protein